jgi:hypothetical protein
MSIVDLSRPCRLSARGRLRLSRVARRLDVDQDEAVERALIHFLATLELDLPPFEHVCSEGPDDHNRDSPA